MLTALLLTLAPANAQFNLSAYEDAPDAASAMLSEYTGGITDEVRLSKTSGLADITDGSPPLASGASLSECSVENNNSSARFPGADEIYREGARLDIYQGTGALDGPIDTETLFSDMPDGIAREASTQSDIPFPTDTGASTDSNPVGEGPAPQESNAAIEPEPPPDADSQADNTADSKETGAVLGNLSRNTQYFWSSGPTQGENGNKSNSITYFINRGGGDKANRQPSVSAEGYIWPAEGILTSPFGYRNATVGSSNHKGIDICAKANDPIYAADAGEVIVSEWSGSYGNYIAIRHDNGHVTLYAHCSSLLTEVGQRVKQGHIIALMGQTGRATAVHLHFELKIDGKNVDPELYLT